MNDNTLTDGQVIEHAVTARTANRRRRRGIAGVAVVAAVAAVTLFAVVDDAPPASDGETAMSMGSTWS